MGATGTTRKANALEQQGQQLKTTKAIYVDESLMSTISGSAGLTSQVYNRNNPLQNQSILPHEVYTRLVNFT